LSGLPGLAGDGGTAAGYRRTPSGVRAPPSRRYRRVRDPGNHLGPGLQERGVAAWKQQQQTSWLTARVWPADTDSRSIAQERPAGCGAQATFTGIPEAELQRTGVCGPHGPGPAGAPCSAWQAARACVLRPTLAGDRRRTVTRGVLTASQATRRQAGREWGLRPHARAARPLGSEVPERRATGERFCGWCATAPVAVRWWQLRAQAPFADRLSAGCLVVDQAAVGDAPPRSPASVGRRTRATPARCRSRDRAPVRTTPPRKRSQRPTAMCRNPHSGFCVIDRDLV
jgi:hypothetical protein